MHTVLITLAGFLLLALCVGIGHLRGGPAGRARAARLFPALWFVLALANALVGVFLAGYSLLQELPVFLVTFALPALVAWWIARRPR